MGKIYTKLFGKKEVRIIITGLDAAGKTTTLYRLKLGEVVTTIPTIGFNVETVEHQNLKITMWDLGGRDKARALHRHYFPNTDALIYIVDSNDKERIGEGREELHRYLKEDELRECPLLVLANKQDLDNAMSSEYVTEQLDLHKLRDRPWHIQATCATTGDGLYEGLDWLADSIGYNKARESVKLATSSLAESGKDITTGWSYAVCGVQRLRAWLWTSATPT